MSFIGRNVYFSDIFQVSRETIKKYGAFNISLVNDLPLFVDPFLLFRSSKQEYRDLHKQIIDYLRFLLKLSKEYSKPDKGLLQTYFQFPEIKENWLGFSLIGNSGSGLGRKFAKALYDNLGGIFREFGNESITKSSHLEKLCVISEGVGRDYISDFTTNLILDYLLKYTENFTKKHIPVNLSKCFNVSHVFFDYRFEIWQSKDYILPCHKGQYVILTPCDILTRDDTWINQTDMIDDIETIAKSLPDCQLRTALDRYLSHTLQEDFTKEEKKKRIMGFYKLHPELVDYYIRDKENRQDEAEQRSTQYVMESESFFIDNIKELSCILLEKGFYSDCEHEDNAFDEAKRRVLFLRDVIENQDGYKYFFHDGKPVGRESDLQLMYRLVWYDTDYDVNREVNNGRGPVDFKISKGSKDKSLVEFKLASNSKLKQNLEYQVEVYKKANGTKNALKVILCLSEPEIEKTKKLLMDLDLSEDKGVYIINATPNKVSASNVKNEEEL